MKVNAINWFEIPAEDLERATTFYEAIFDLQLVPMDLGEFRMRMFPTEPGGVGGAICHSPGFYQPSTTGALVYLNGNPDLQVVLDRIETAGGKILIPKTQISDEIGYMAVFQDTEGNRVALHSDPVAQ
ncbi:VOC family protein [Aridibaculum aurantiacum]|uniref:VOC family protein n=1 Tax=Aridibaculum aurantiacum TaxID=2810307 RepID=UPI001A9673F7|nr:VOC family protein [Aridibaculum aurantiacum]